MFLLLFLFSTLLVTYMPSKASAGVFIGLTTVTLYAMADAYVNATDPYTNYGNVTSLELGLSEGEHRRYAYITFNLSTIPSDATIISGELAVYLSSISGYVASIGVHRCADISWEEREVTWSNKPGFTAEATDSVYFGTLVIVNRRYYWNVTADVQDALNIGRLTEVLKFEWSDKHTYASFRSRETTSAPYLKIEYITPPVYDVHVDSVQDTGVTSNLGTIAIGDAVLELPQDMVAKRGSYQLAYNSGYIFLRWETSGGVSVSDVYAQNTTVFVLGSGTLRAVGNARLIEYFYDDGAYDMSSYGKQGEIQAIRITPLLSDKLVIARFYFTSVSPTTPFKVHVMDGDRRDLIAPFNQTPTVKGWFDIDLSGYGLTVNAGTDFYIGVEWTTDYSPQLGYDQSSPNNRSWYWDGTTWKTNTYQDYMIRAIVGTPRASSTISCSTSPTSIVIGSNVTVSGLVNPVHSGAKVTLTFTRPDSVVVKKTVTPSVTGEYNFTYTPDRAGLWKVKADWSGDEDHNGAMSPAASFTVSKASSSISCSLSSSTILLGETVNISGSISPTHPNLTVYIRYSRDGGTWDTVTTTTDSMGVYSYTWAPRVGSYSVRSYWDGDADHNGSTSLEQSIKVLKNASTITCTLNPETITIGASTTISGIISPSHTASVTVRYSKDGGITWITITATTSQQNGSYSYAWKPTLGTYQVKASWLGDAEHEGAESQIQTLTVAKASSTISCSVSPEKVKKNEVVTVLGSISPVHAGVSLTLTYKRPDGSTFTRTLATTATGTFNEMYKPETTGSWSVTARWEGDQDHSPATSTAFTFVVEEDFPILPIAIALIAVAAVILYFLLKRGRG